MARIVDKNGEMPQKLDRIMLLEVPIIVRIGSRKMSLGEVVGLTPGMIVELPQQAGDQLDLLVNNKPIGSGTAVKVGENFGLKISYIGEAKDRIEAMGPNTAATGGGPGADVELHPGT